MDLPDTTLTELQSSLMLFFTGAAHHSWTILKDQEKSSEKRSGASIESLHQIRGLADRMRDALRAGELRAFGEMLDEGWQAKKSLSGAITTARIDELYRIARQNGAIGGKITGAGGGGFLLLFCEPSKQERVRKAFQHLGVREMGFRFDFNGAQVITNDPFIDGDQRCGCSWTFIPNSPEVQFAL